MRIFKKIFGTKRLSPKQFAEALLLLSNSFDEDFRRLFVDELDFEGDQKVLNLELRILSMWIITLSIPNDQYRDIIHSSFCKQAGFSEKETDLFFQQVDARYKTYFEAYNIWVDTKNGHMIGTSIIETILNGNVGYSPKTDTLPLVGATEAWKVFVHFSESFKATLGMIKNLKDKYEIEGM